MSVFVRNITATRQQHHKPAQISRPSTIRIGASRPTFQGVVLVVVSLFFIISDSTTTQDNTTQPTTSTKRKDYTMSHTSRIIEEVNNIHHDYAAVVTPEKKKQRRFKEEPSDEEKSLQEEKDEDDRKMAPIVKEESQLNEGRIIKEVNNIHHDYAAVGTPEEESQSDEELIDGDTILGFPMHPNLTNRQIMLGNYAFVTWARRQKEPRGRLVPFLEWCDSDEARALEMEGRGNEKFTFGLHKGYTFHQIYERDPDYHKRYTFMLRKSGEEAPEPLRRYIDWVSGLQRMSHSAMMDDTDQ